MQNEEVHFHLYQRKKSTGKVYYYRIYDPEIGERTSGKSTGQSNRKAAERYVMSLFNRGELKLRGNPTLNEFAQDFWLWDRCEYIKRKLARGKSISRGHADTMRSYLLNHILPELGLYKLRSLTPRRIEDWLLQLVEKPGIKGNAISSVTANNILRSLHVILNEAVKNEYIVSNPADKVEPLQENSREKGILTIDEVRQLFLEDNIPEVWNGDCRHYTLNLLACSTGMRMGEIQALKVRCVHDDYVQVFWSWSRKYGMKQPKTRTSQREIPIPSKVSTNLADLLRYSPFKDPDDLVFHDGDPQIPIYYKTISDRLYKALKAIGIPEEKRRERKLSFHSHRYWLNSILRGRVAEYKVRIITGHADEKMTDHYHVKSLEDFEDVRQIQARFFI